LQGGRSLEELAACYKQLQVPKGIARMAFAIALGCYDRGIKPKKTLNKIAYRIIELMMEKNADPKLLLDGWKDLQDRLDGKPSQAVALTDPDGGKLSINIVRFADQPSE
jgi:hypothetical protein